MASTDLDQSTGCFLLGSGFSMTGRLFAFQIQVKWGEANFKEAEVNKLKGQRDLKVAEMERTDQALKVSFKPWRFFEIWKA